MGNLEMLKHPAKSEMKPLEVEGVSASALLEGQQEGVAEARLAREADHTRQMEDLLREIEQLKVEIAEQDEALTGAENAIAKSQGVIDADPTSASAEVHKKVIALRNTEIETALAKKAELEGRKVVIEELRDGLVN